MTISLLHKIGANRVELVQLMQKFVQRSRVGIFCKKAPDPYHWTLNSCSSAFRNIGVPLGPFRYFVKLGANRAELVQLMQKFVQRSCIGIFCNEGTQSIPLDPKLIFLCVLKWLGCIWTISLLHKTRCKSVPTSAKMAKVRATKSLRNFSQQRHPIHTIGS